MDSWLSKRREPFSSMSRASDWLPLSAMSRFTEVLWHNYVRNGAHFIGVITNDGWWRDTPGHKQHLHYAVLRAIENRRSIARSANTGISAFINQKGQILQPTNFWEQDVIRANLKANSTTTFYTQHGDYLGRTATWLSVLVFLAAWVKRRIT